MNNLKNTSIPESPEVMSMENTNPLQGGTPLYVVDNTEPWKRILMANAISITSSLIPIIYESIKSDPTMKGKKLTKEQLLELMWYNIPPVISVIRKLAGGSKFSPFLAKTELLVKAAPLVPVVQAILKNKDKEGLAKIDMQVVIKTIPFVSNIVAPHVVRDPKAIFGVVNLSITFMPMILMFMGTVGKSNKLKKYATIIPGFIEIFKQVTGVFSKYFGKDNGSQYSGIFGAQARSNGIFGMNNGGTMNMINDIGRVMNTITRVGQVMNNNSNNYIGNNNSDLYGANAVNNQNLYYNRGPII